jgi:hypothetical protein
VEPSSCWNHKEDALSPTQFRDFITANGTPAQQALVGAVDTDWQMRSTEHYWNRSQYCFKWRYRQYSI